LKVSKWDKGKGKEYKGRSGILKMTGTSLFLRRVQEAIVNFVLRRPKRLHFFSSKNNYFIPTSWWWWLIGDSN